MAEQSRQLKKKRRSTYVMNCAQHFSTTLAEACRDFLKLKSKFRGTVQSARPATTHPHYLKYRRRLRRDFRVGPTTSSGGDRVTLISSPRKSQNQRSSSPRRLYAVRSSYFLWPRKGSLPGCENWSVSTSPNHSFNVSPTRSQQCAQYLGMPTWTKGRRFVLGTYLPPYSSVTGCMV